jgi:putative acetyltransferase
MIRPEKPSDYAAIHALHSAAFGSSLEAELIGRLRADGDAVIALVAVDDDQLTGHVMLSRMRSPPRALGLGPVAVRLGHRRQGIGARLIEKGIAPAKAGPWDIVFVVGDPAYYGRFGFRADDATRFGSAYSGPHFMVLALTPNARTMAGPAEYAAAFSRTGIGHCGPSRSSSARPMSRTGR